jgi:hypothetical protein
MAETRDKIQHELGALRDRVLGTGSTSNRRAQKNMATKKASAKTNPSKSRAKAAAGKKGGKAAKATAAKARRSSGRKKATGGRKKTLKSQTRKVVTDALEGAAVGAVKGAAEAIATDMARE